MLCEEMQNRILDGNELSAGQRKELETHMAMCAECHGFAQALDRLDGALSATLKVPALSANFEQRLWKRIQETAPVMSETDRAERRRQLEAEFEAGRTRIQRGTWAWRNLVASLTWPVAAAVAAGVVLRFMPQLMAQSSSTQFWGLVPLLAASGIFVAMGLAEGFPKRI